MTLEQMIKDAEANGQLEFHGNEQGEFKLVLNAPSETFTTPFFKLSLEFVTDIQLKNISLDAVKSVINGLPTKLATLRLNNLSQEVLGYIAVSLIRLDKHGKKVPEIICDGSQVQMFQNLNNKRQARREQDRREQVRREQVREQAREQGLHPSLFSLYSFANRGEGDREEAQQNNLVDLERSTQVSRPN